MDPKPRVDPSPPPIVGNWPTHRNRGGQDRHTAVALLIDQGADLFFVSRFVGHSDIRTTANTYGHLFPQRGEAVADLMGTALKDALARRVRFSGDLGSVTDLSERAFGAGDAS